MYDIPHLSLNRLKFIDWNHIYLCATSHFPTNADFSSYSRFGGLACLYAQQHIFKIYMPQILITNCDSQYWRKSREKVWWVASLLHITHTREYTGGYRLHFTWNHSTSTLTCYSLYYNESRLVKVLRWRYGYALPKYPSVYVRVSAARDLIREQTGF